MGVNFFFEKKTTTMQDMLVSSDRVYSGGLLVKDYYEEYIDNLYDAIYSEFLIKLKGTRYFKTNNNWVHVHFDGTGKILRIDDEKPLFDFKSDFYFYNFNNKMIKLNNRNNDNENDDDDDETVAEMLKVSNVFCIINDCVHTNDFLFFDALINLYIDFNTHLFIKDIVESLPYIVNGLIGRHSETFEL